MVTNTNESVTNTAKQITLNTHCIVCGTAFPTARMGKLYCSPRCKQFGYNHKHEISQALATRERGISPKPLSFFIDDYMAYNKTHRLLKRYRELEKKRLSWEEANQEIKLRHQCGLSSPDYLWDRYTGRKLTEAEESELYDAECTLPEEVLGLNLKDLSLEQWSFIKSLHLNLDDPSFLEVSSSFSDSFIKQLTINNGSCDNSPEELIIKNKFNNHCNLIALGIITFVKREKVEAESS